MAIGTAAAIGLGAAGLWSFLGGKSANKAATKAADTSLQVAQMNNALAQQGIDLSRDIYNQNKNTLAPFVGSGVQSGNRLNAFLGFGSSEDRAAAQQGFQQYIQGSDYGFQFGEGANRVNSGYAGSGTLQSGAAMKGLERFRQDLQSGYRGQYMNLLANQQGVGLGAASATAGVGQNYVGNVLSGQNNMMVNNQNAGDNAANAILARGNNNPFANAIGLLGGGLFGMSNGFGGSNSYGSTNTWPRGLY